jgi:hypothetical protein
MTRLDETGLPRANPLPHPTPQHIRASITQRVFALQGVPHYTILNAVDEAIREACAEHDREQGK